ncbi:hypothetical protein MKW98_021045 [Papaver atlanticum]|uniref:Uncharacterized protein n=1 Tax=Papaver atlanticum TaxID=357466 RepID=A0AAD4T9W3_9MAGN|nr:hypothetical protein MKW98_021045 [Papaver atlanticum]
MVDLSVSLMGFTDNNVNAVVAGERVPDKIMRKDADLSHSFPARSDESAKLGWSKFISRKELSDPANGYMDKEDSLMIGVKVFGVIGVMMLLRSILLLAKMLVMMMMLRIIRYCMKDVYERWLVSFLYIYMFRVLWWICSFGICNFLYFSMCCEKQMSRHIYVKIANESACFESLVCTKSEICI